MARARNIKPGFFTDGALSKLSIPARYLFAALWCMADREGRLVESMEDIEIFAFPRDRVDVDALLCELAPRFITRYESGSARFLRVNHFGRHQNPHPNEKVSYLPPPPEAEAPREPEKDQAKPVPGHEMSRQASECSRNYASTPADSLIPESQFPDPGTSDVRIPESLGSTGASAPPPAPEQAKIKRSIFKPPTVEEVKAYCTERGNQVDPARFIDFYEANGWKVGKNPMKDWRAAVRTWEARGEDARGHPAKAQKPFDPFSLPNTPDRYKAQEDDFGAEFMKRLGEKQHAKA